ncbi:adenylate/guanylate cyclase domain-containing protein [uncultured Ferrovibrio sp.]|jgi:adenylate cyclase|uniref:adenylate/guanylate cyclase domain-containing protein n=1 Tax=uncultured Ferrovibrio sp. TaxID=1576913 RepID=UPI00261BE513|nr:adenylate/guanylate cyclase domain-containing protein [uncultured Ferrovibrio sp.]
MMIRPARRASQANIRRSRLRIWAIMLTIAIVAGAVYGASIATILGAAPAWFGAVRGAFTGLVIGGLIGGFEIFIVNGERTHLRHLPFAKLLLVKEVVYVSIILGGEWLGSTVFLIEESPGFGFNTVTAVTFAFSLLFALIVNFLIEVSLLLGPGVLGNFLRGYYHRPRREDRLLVFFDMRNSTAIAERIGDLAFHNLLNRFFSDLTEPVLAWRGSIHKYVGDEMIVTWPLDQPGRDPSGAYKAAMAARERIADAAESYLREFGVAPDFRTVLHAGTVVVGEMGAVKREIGLLGDTINTTAKIEAATKPLDHPVIASNEALTAARLPEGLQAVSLGPYQLPGKSNPIELHSIS